MKRYIVVLLVLFSFLSMAEAEEGVINDKPLRDIDDIVWEVTGTHTVIKKSFLKFRNDADGSFKFSINWSDANLDGTDVKLNESKSYETGHAAGKTNTGIHPVAGKKRTSDGKLVVVFPSTVSSGTEKLFINSLKISGNIDDHSITNDAYHYHSATGKLSNLYISDSASGLFPSNNGDREVFAITYFIANGGKRPGFSQSFNAHLCLFDPETNQSKVHSLGVMNGLFPSVRVVAGDFDNDGKENELAIIRDGGNADYYLTVYRVSGLDIGNAIYSASLGARENTEADNSDGCEIVAGDFNNDGKSEFAAIYADFKDTSSFANPGGDYYPTVTIFSWKDSTFIQKSKTDQNDNLHLGTTHWTSSSYVPHFGLIAEVEDIDGNGTDDIVLLTASYGGSEGNIVASVWDTDKNLNPSVKCLKKTSTKIAGFGGTMGEDPAECSYLPRSLSLGLVPMGDKSNGENACRILVTKSQGGDKRRASNDYRTGDEIFYMMVNNTNGSVSSLSDLTLWKSGSKGYATAVVPGDFYTECVELADDPEHLIYEKDRVYAAEVQTPPYHVDFIQPDFPIGESTLTSKKVVNVSFSGSYSQYQQTQSTSTRNDVSFTTTSSTEWGVDAKAGGSYKLFGVETSGGYKDMASTINNETESAQATRTLAISETASGSDNVVLYTTNRHVWRYQILSYLNKPNDEVGDDKFMTFTLCEAPEIHDGEAGNSSQLDDYNPIHEEGNLFSYPALIEHIPYWGAYQAILSQKKTTTMGKTRSSLTVDLTEVNTNNTTTTTKSKKALNGSLTLSLNVPKYLHASTTATGSYSKELTNTEAYTKTYQKSDKFIIELPASTTGIQSGYTAHSIAAQVYADAAGVMKTAFAVTELNQDAALWNRYGGVYGKKPDPALVLPKRFGIFKDAEGLQKWGAVEHWPTALKLRGISFYDVTAESSTIFSDELNSSRSNLSRHSLIAGHTYKIQIPVYNASFVDAGNVDVEMRICKMNGNADDNTLPDISSLNIIDRQTVRLGGWVDGSALGLNDPDPNKAMVSFDWTIDSSYTESNYRLFFVIDPDNKIDEIHEVWDVSKEGGQYTGDPGGNNVGYAKIAILNSEPEIVSDSSGLSHVAADNVTEDDFEVYFEPVRANDTRTWLTLEEFRGELANMKEDFIAKGKVVYSGTRTLTDVSFTMLRNRSGELSVIADRNIPAIFPNKEYYFSFIVYPERLLSSTFDVSMTGDNLNLSWTKDDGADDDSTPSDSVQDLGSSGGGCDMGMNALVVLSLLALFSLKTKKHR